MTVALFFLVPVRVRVFFFLHTRVIRVYKNILMEFGNDSFFLELSFSTLHLVLCIAIIPSVCHLSLGTQARQGQRSVYTRCARFQYILCEIFRFPASWLVVVLPLLYSSPFYRYEAFPIHFAIATYHKAV